METKTRSSETKQIDRVQIGDKVVITWTKIVLVEVIDEADQLVSEERTSNKKVETCDWPPHKDFLSAMKMLRKPVIDIMENGDYKNFENYEVTGVSFGGEQDDARVVITFQKHIVWLDKLSPGYATPAVPLYDNEMYEGSKQLDKFCKKIIAEAWAYLDGKKADVPQLSLSFETGADMELKVQE